MSDLFDELDDIPSDGVVYAAIGIIFGAGGVLGCLVGALVF